MTITSISLGNPLAHHPCVYACGAVEVSKCLKHLIQNKYGYGIGIKIQIHIYKIQKVSEFWILVCLNWQMDSKFGLDCTEQGILTHCFSRASLVKVTWNHLSTVIYIEVKFHSMCTNVPHKIVHFWYPWLKYQVILGNQLGSGQSTDWRLNIPIDKTRWDNDHIVYTFFCFG